MILRSLLLEIEKNPKFKITKLWILNLNGLLNLIQNRIFEIYYYFNFEKNFDTFFNDFIFEIINELSSFLMNLFSLKVFKNHMFIDEILLNFFQYFNHIKSNNNSNLIILLEQLKMKLLLNIFENQYFYDLIVHDKNLIVINIFSNCFTNIMLYDSNFFDYENKIKELSNKI
jgi:hypothetical protein